MNAREAELQDRVQAWLGTGTMILASLFAVLIFCDRTNMPLFSMPSFWFKSRGVHLVLCGGMFLMAAILLKSPGAPRDDRNGRPLFRSCRFYTRANCHLCDDALGILTQFQDALPTIEIIDIDEDAQLVRQFGESVPVVEIDGRKVGTGLPGPITSRLTADFHRLVRS